VPVAAMGVEKKGAVGSGRGEVETISEMEEKQRYRTCLSDHLEPEADSMPRRSSSVTGDEAGQYARPNPARVMRTTR
jgi:hypothetical protein